MIIKNDYEKHGDSTKKYHVQFEQRKKWTF